MAKNLFLNKKCLPCEKGARPFSKSTAMRYLRGMKGWTLSNANRSIAAAYIMKDFMAAVMLVDRIAVLAEKEGHHPDIHLTGYRKLKLELSTHAINGLSENDFILAAKISQLPKTLKVIK